MKQGGERMGVSYNRLWKLLIDKGWKKRHLKEAANLSPSLITSLNQNRSVTTNTLVKICNALDCRIEDINEYLFTKNKGIYFIITSKYDIEHIMPASGKNLSQIRIDAGITDEDEFNSTVNKLGNKILLEEDINRSIGNGWFRTKIQTSVKKKSGHKDSQYAIATALVEKYRDQEKPYWLKSDINDATGKIAKRISDFIFQKWKCCSNSHINQVIDMNGGVEHGGQVDHLE